MIHLYSVMDIRTGKVHSEIIVKKNKAKYFVPAEPEETE